MEDEVQKSGLSADQILDEILRLTEQQTTAKQNAEFIGWTSGEKRKYEERFEQISEWKRLLAAAK